MAQGLDRTRCLGGLIAALALAGPAVALQSTTTLPVTPSPIAGGPKTYTECVRAYANQPNAQATCARLFPSTAPAASTPSTGSTAPAQTSTPTETSQPVDITPQLNKLLDAWKSRPKPTPKTPADPLAVIPDIQAACAAYVAVPERWRRCAADGWRTAGLKGQPPLVLQNPPVVEPPPVVQPPVTPPSVTPPYQPPVVQSTPPVQTPPPLTPETVAPETVTPAPVAAPEPPPAAILPPTPAPPPTVIPPPPPRPPATPIWFWLAALIATAAAGFGLAKLLERLRKPPPPAPCPDIALVVDPGVVFLTPDGSPRAGMAVSLHFERAAEDDAVGLDYPTLETAP